MEAIVSHDLYKIFSIIVIIAMILNIGLAFVLIFLEQRQPSATWAWLMVLFFLPVIGFIIYIFFGRRVSNKHLFNLQHDERIGLDELVENQKRMLDDGSFPYVSEEVEKHKDMVNMMLVSQPAFLTTNNHIDVFTDGRKLFDEMLKDLMAAKHHIHIEYYIFELDGLGEEIMDVLYNRLKAGVEIKMLYDDVGSKKLRLSDFDQFRKDGGHVEAFFKSWLPKINFRLNNRDHRKIVVIDGKVGYVGGFNVGDEYLGLNKKYGYWRDTHVRIMGDGVHALQLRFMLDWNSQGKRAPMSYQSEYFPEHIGQGDKSVQIASSGPEQRWHQLKFGYMKMIMSAKKSIYIQSPYFIPDQSFIDILKIVARSGVSVHLMIPDKPDHPFVYWATYSNASELLDAGIQVYTYQKGFIHAKTLVIDDEVASVGTANMDFRSFELNFEINAFIYDREIATELRKTFENDIQDCKPLTQEVYDARGTVIKIKEAIARLVSPIM